MALVGIKRIISGANNDITNTFGYTSPNLISSSTLYLAGRDSIQGKFFSLNDPNYPKGIWVFMPLIDMCKGETCQVNMITIKDPPFKPRNSQLLGSTLSISFEKQTVVNQNTIEVEQIRVQNLALPIIFNFSIQGINNISATKRCVYFDTKLNKVSDQGIQTSYNPVTG